MQINFFKCLLSQNFEFFDEYLQIHLQKNKLQYYRNSLIRYK